MTSNNNPQTEPDYGEYKSFVESTEGFKNWLKDVIAYNKKHPKTLYKTGFSLDYENWKAEDIRDLYFSRSWSGAIEFVRLSEAAGQKSHGSYTADAICAQAALAAVMPKRLEEEAKAQGKKGWELFKEMIDEADGLIKADSRYPEKKKYIDEEQQKLREQQNKNLKQNDDKGAIDLPELKGFGSIAPQREFNQQEALAMLEKHSVVKDGNDVLRAPLETQITDAVKGIKTNIRAA